jgi:hypothetical protein
MSDYGRQPRRLVGLAIQVLLGWPYVLGADFFDDPKFDLLLIYITRIV